MRLFLLMAIAAMVAGCGTFVPVEDMSKVGSEERAAALQIKTYIVGLSPESPYAVIEPVNAYSCKHLIWDKPASKGDALQQLKQKAYRLGANAIMDVEFDTRGTDTWGTNCWESVQASGIAIRIK